MSVQIAGTGEDGQVISEVDGGHKALRASLRPMSVMAWSSFGARTGVVPGGTGAGGTLFSLRNLGPNLLLVRRLSAGFATNAAFTTAQRIEFALTIARAFTAGDSSGTAINMLAGKHKATLTTPNAEARVAATGPLTVGVRTLDQQPIGFVSGGSNGLGTGLSLTPLISHDTGDYPVVLAPNEGLVLTNEFALGVAGSIVGYVNVEFAEALLTKWP